MPVHERLIEQKNFKDDFISLKNSTIDVCDGKGEKA